MSMDFVLGLPHTQWAMNSNFVIADKFLKMTHFIACQKTKDTSLVARLYFNKVVRLHDIPKSITSYRDVNFIINFWKSSWEKVRTQLNFSSAYHPQTNGQIMVVNCSLSNLLRSQARDKPK